MEHLCVKKIEDYIVDFVSRVSMVRKRLIAFSNDLCPKIVAASTILSQTNYFPKPFLISNVRYKWDNINPAVTSVLYYAVMVYGLCIQNKIHNGSSN